MMDKENKSSNIKNESHSLPIKKRNSLPPQSLVTKDINLTSLQPLEFSSQKESNDHKNESNNNIKYGYSKSEINISTTSDEKEGFNGITNEKTSHEVISHENSLINLKKKFYSKSLNDGHLNKESQFIRNKYLKSHSNKEDIRIRTRNSYLNSEVNNEINNDSPISDERINSKFNNNIYIANLNEDDDDSISKGTNSYYKDNRVIPLSYDYPNTNNDTLGIRPKKYTESSQSSSEYITIKNTNDFVNEKQTPSLNETLISDVNDNSEIDILDIVHPINDISNSNINIKVIKMITVKIMSIT